MKKHKTQKYRNRQTRLIVSLLLTIFLTVSSTGTVCANTYKMKYYAKELAEKCYPDERIFDSAASVMLGDTKVTTGANVFMTNRIELHFIMHMEKVMEGLLEIVVDEVKCIEQGEDVPCPCDNIPIGGQAASEESQVYDIPAGKIDSQKIELNQLENYINKSVQIKMKNGTMHEDAVITKVEATRISIMQYKYGGQVKYSIQKDEIEYVTK